MSFEESAGTDADALQGSRFDRLLELVQAVADEPHARRVREQSARPLGEHVTEYEAFLTSKGDGAKHVRDATTRVKLMIVLTGARRPTDITPSSVRAAMDRLREPGTDAGPPRRGPSTVNHYLHAVRAFCRWLQQDARAPASMIEGVQALNASLDRRRVRRPLTPDEAARLIRTVEARNPARAMVYKVALTTGLRAGELRSLTVASFDMTASPATVTVAAAYSKHRRRDVLPLVADVAADLSRYMDGWSSDRPAFRVPRNTAKMVRRDLAAAGIAYCEGGRFADFHAQRHTFVTLLVRGGANVKITQHLARHSDPRMTLGLYAHTDTAECGRALDCLPRLPRAGVWSHGESNPDLLNAIQPPLTQAKQFVADITMTRVPPPAVQLSTEAVDARSFASA